MSAHREAHLWKNLEANDPIAHLLSRLIDFEDVDLGGGRSGKRATWSELTTTSLASVCLTRTRKDVTVSAHQEAMVNIVEMMLDEEVIEEIGSAWSTYIAEHDGVEPPGTLEELYALFGSGRSSDGGFEQVKLTAVDASSFVTGVLVHGELAGDVADV